MSEMHDRCWYPASPRLKCTVASAMYWSDKVDIDLVRLTQAPWSTPGASIYVTELRIAPKPPDFLDRWNFREHPILTLAQKYGRLVEIDFCADGCTDAPVTEPLISISRSFSGMHILTSLQEGDIERIESDPDFLRFLQLLENELRQY